MEITVIDQRAVDDWTDIECDITEYDDTYQVIMTVVKRYRIIWFGKDEYPNIESLIAHLEAYGGQIWHEPAEPDFE